MLRVQVEWLDSGLQRSDGWETKEAIISEAKLVVVNSVGFLMHEDETTLYLALSHDPEHDHYFGVQLIGKESVRKIILLRARQIGLDSLATVEESEV